MKRLLICSPSHAIHGGVETIVNDLCRELPNRGWDTVLALGKGARFNDVDAYKKAHPDLPIAEIDGTKGTQQARVEGLNKVIARYRPEAIITARIYDVFEAVARIAVSESRPRIVAAIRVFEPHYLFDARMHRDGIDLFAADGELLAAILMNWCGADPSRVVSIPGGVRPPIAANHHKSVSESIRLGFVGRLEQEQKRILDFIPFVEKLDATGIKYSLKFVGTGPDEEELKRKLRNSIQRGVVSFCGWETPENLYRKLYPNLDCFVHFANSEGVTIAPREAMVHGVVPVISEFFGLLSEGHFVNNHNSLTFKVGDVDSAVSNILKLKSEPGLFQRLSRNASRSQRGKYTFSGSMDAWAQALNECLEKPALSRQPKVPRLIDGRLARMGVPPAVAQRMRDLIGKRHVHVDPGSEWPTGSGLMTNQAADEILEFARRIENKMRQTADQRSADCSI